MAGTVRAKNYVGRTALSFSSKTFTPSAGAAGAGAGAEAGAASRPATRLVPYKAGRSTGVYIKAGPQSKG